MNLVDRIVMTLFAVLAAIFLVLFILTDIRFNKVSTQTDKNMLAILKLEQQMSSRTKVLKRLGTEHGLEVHFILERAEGDFK